MKTYNGQLSKRQWAWIEAVAAAAAEAYRRGARDINEDVARRGATMPARMVGIAEARARDMAGIPG